MSQGEKLLRDLDAKLTDLLNRIASVVIRLLVPGDIRDLRLESSFPASEEKLVLLAKKTLRGNLSSLFEPSFRSEVLAILTAWNRKETSYWLARKELEEAITNGRKLGSKVPSYPISQILTSFGFFSTSNLVQGGGRLVSLKKNGKTPNNVKTLSSKDKQKLASFCRFLKTGDRDQLPMDKNEEGLFIEGIFPSSGGTSTCLVIGPGLIDDGLEPAGFEEVIFLLTPNSSLTRFNWITQRSNCTVYVNSEMARNLLFDQNFSHWLGPLESAKHILCKPGFEEAIKKSIGTQTSTPRRDFLKLWDGMGDPNMLQLACYYSLSQGWDIHAEGVDLFLGANTYSQEKPRAQGASSRADFFTCHALSSHNPKINFNFLRLLDYYGWIVGGDTLRTIIAMEENEYLLALDSSLGMKRA